MATTTKTTKKAKKRETNQGKELFVLTGRGFARYIISHETPKYYHVGKHIFDPVTFRIARFPKERKRAKIVPHGFIMAYLAYAEACEFWKQLVSLWRENKAASLEPDAERYRLRYSELTPKEREYMPTPEEQRRKNADKLAELSALQDLLTDEVPAEELRKLGFLKWHD